MGILVVGKDVDVGVCRGSNDPLHACSSLLRLVGIGPQGAVGKETAVGGIERA